ncbi:glycosyltransferase [Pedobacter foliorum]|uniref:glycosyltransferase family 2 protein n=1 Tax=Pedobacter foliorum TaxID=2739058 RepID=UPI001566162E|nr:glycosyltransferase [Pedobacter foliorum]NRF37246.1 glycosyltransferase [Pedobacter foliorum]
MAVSEHDLMVSVCCITYNHEKYIAQALEGFLMQETNFKYEILIGEDKSTDGTKAVVEAYRKQYPEMIKLITHDTNIGAIRNQIGVLTQAKGKYVAMCDGDDFWTDASKLQKQVDFLEANDDYVICCHHSEVIDDQDKIVYVKDSPVALEFDYKDVLLGKREETRICSLMMRNIKEVTEVTAQSWYLDTYGTDTLLKLYAVANTGKKIYVLPDVMACYRYHNGGIWSMIDPKVRKSRMISDFNLTIKNFQYSSLQKRELLNIYFKQYFLFDIRYFNFSSAFQTITALW